MIDLDRKDGDDRPRLCGSSNSSPDIDVHGGSEQKDYPMRDEARVKEELEALETGEGEKEKDDDDDDVDLFGDDDDDEEAAKEATEVSSVGGSGSSRSSVANLHRVIGIETLITRGLSQQVDEERRLHTVAVLEEQRVQRQQGIRDPEKLSKVSRLSSCLSRERARKLATSPSAEGAVEFPLIAESARNLKPPSPQADRQDIPEFDLLLVGDGGVEKAAFVESHLTGNDRNASQVDDCTALVFHSNRGPIQFNVRSVNGRDFGPRTAIWCDCAIIMFDLTSRITYMHATNLHRDITRACGSIPIVLLGSNAESKDRKVKSKQIEAFIRKKNIPYFDTSVKPNYNLEAPFLWLAREMTGNPLLHFMEPTLSDSDWGGNDNGGREFEVSDETMDECVVENDPANRLSPVAEAAKASAAEQKPLSSSQTYEMSGSDSDFSSDEVVDVEKAAFFKRVNERNTWRVDECLDQRSRGRRAAHEQARAACSITSDSPLSDEEQKPAAKKQKMRGSPELPCSPAASGEFFTPESFDEPLGNATGLQNDNDPANLPVAEAAQPAAEEATAAAHPAPAAPTTTAAAPAPAASEWGDLFKKTPGEWKCDVCAVLNPKEAGQCLSCETAKPGGVGGGESGADESAGNGSTNTATGGSTTGYYTGQQFSFGSSPPSSASKSAGKASIGTGGFSFGTAPAVPAALASTTSQPFLPALTNENDPANQPSLVAEGAKPPAAKQKPLSPMQTYEMSDREANSDSDSDSDEEENQRPRKTIPEWAQKANLHRALERQFAAGPDRLDPDKIFGEVLTCDLEEIFGKKTSRYRKRTSSGNWSKDGVLPAEKVIYKRHMAAALAMPLLEED